MKTKIILIFILFATMDGTTTAQTLRNSSGSQIGKIESDGTVRDGKSNRLGKIESDGAVRNDKGNSIGKADGSTRQRIGAIY